MLTTEFKADSLIGSWSLDKNTPAIEKWDPYRLQKYYPQVIFRSDSILCIRGYCGMTYAVFRLCKNKLIVTTSDTVNYDAIVYKLNNDSLLMCNFFKCNDTVLYIKDR